MSFHDAYLRRTPVDVLFPQPESAEEWMGEVLGIGEEAATRDLAAFLGLAPVRSLMDRVLATDSDGAAESPLGTMSFFAFHALRAGDVRLAETATLRAAARPGGGKAHPEGPLAWPRGAGYVQVPRNLLWTTPESGMRPEPVDGFFWYVPEEPLASLLLISGLIAGRPDLHVTLVQDAPLEDADIWEQQSMRDDGADFASTLPGGEQLYALANLGEALKLAGRLLRLPTTPPKSTEPRVPTEPQAPMETVSASVAEQGSTPVDAARSWLAYRVIDIHAES